MSVALQVPHHVLVDAVGGEHMVNGTCVERMLKDVLPVVRVLACFLRCSGPMGGGSVRSR